MYELTLVIPLQHLAKGKNRPPTTHEGVSLEDHYLCCNFGLILIFSPFMSTDEMLLKIFEKGTDFYLG